MAGMLPGVEAARRRRIHNSRGSSLLGNNNTSSYFPSRRSSFSLYCPNSPSSFSALPRSDTCQDDEKLGPLAREARERLDEKLRSQRKPIFIRNNSNDQIERNGRLKGGTVKNELRAEVYGTKSKIIGWPNLGWKSGEQECGICF